MAAAFAGCADDERGRRLGSTCSSPEQCRSGFCYDGTCLDPAADPDLDGLINEVEASIHTELTNLDSDGDGIPDGDEVGPNATAPRDTDGDDDPSLRAHHDALESALADADGDCVPDQFDDDDATPPSEIAAAVCPLTGVCEGLLSSLGTTCSPTARDEGGFAVPVCDLSGLAAPYQPAEAICDGLDNDCDGETDEGGDALCDDGDPCTLGACGGSAGCVFEPVIDLPLLGLHLLAGVGEGRRAVVLSGGRIALAAGRGGLQVLSEPGAAFAVDGVLALGGDTGEPAQDVLELEEDFLVAVAAGRAGLVFAGLDTPGAPELLGSVPMPAGGFAYALARIDPIAAEVGSAFALVAGGDAGLLVAGATDPPSFVASLVLPGPALDVDSDGALAVVALGAAGLAVVTLDDDVPPEAPALAATWSPPFGAHVHHAALDGAVAWVSLGSAGVRSLDLTSPASPVELGALPTPGQATHVTLAGDLAFATLAGGGLVAVDRTDPVAPVSLALLPLPGAVSATVAEDRLVVAARGGVFVLDLEDAAAGETTLLSSLPLGSAVDLALDGSSAWIALGAAGLGVWNLEAPLSDPIVLSGGAPALAVAAAAGRAWVAAGDGGLVVAAPNLSDPLDLAAPALDVAAAGDVAVVALGGGGLAVARLSEAGDPVLLGSATLPGEAVAVALDAGPPARAFVALGAGGLVAVDLSDPASPLPGPAVALDGPALDLAWNGASLYAALGPAGVARLGADLDLSELAAVPGQGAAVRVSAGSDLVFAGLEPLGLWLLSSDGGVLGSLGVLAGPTPTAAVAVPGGRVALALGPGGVALRERVCPAPP